MGNAKNLAFWAILILLLVTLFSVFQDGSGNGGGREISYSEFIDRVEAGEISEATIDGETVVAQTTGRDRVITVQPRDADTVEVLRANNVNINVEPQERGGLLSTLGFWLPMLIIFGIWIFFLNRMQGGGRGAMGFGKSKAKLLTEKT
ncbi:MAG: ATP-dependent metallopeptidase FtsH/Yme1/Tma family protein, partial [Pseudomonadota bacterium]